MLKNVENNSQLILSLGAIIWLPRELTLKQITDN